MAAWADCGSLESSGSESTEALGAGPLAGGGALTLRDAAGDGARLAGGVGAGAGSVQALAANPNPSTPRRRQPLSCSPSSCRS